MSFEWKDGPILKAIKNGEWILLDEVHFFVVFFCEEVDCYLSEILFCYYIILLFFHAFMVI